MQILIPASALLIGLIVGVKFPQQVVDAYKLLLAFLIGAWDMFIDKCFTNSKAYKTDKGDWVKSKGERQIANFLHEQKIDYIYEKPLTLSNGVVVHPDFYLNKYNTYIEYFGKLGDKVYNRNIALKKNSYKKDGIKCIELYPNNLNNLENIFMKRFEKVTGKTFPQRKYFNYRNQRGLKSRFENQLKLAH